MCGFVCCIVSCFGFILLNFKGANDLVLIVQALQQVEMHLQGRHAGLSNTNQHYLHVTGKVFLSCGGN